MIREKKSLFDCRHLAEFVDTNFKNMNSMDPDEGNIRYTYMCNRVVITTTATKDLVRAQLTR